MIGIFDSGSGGLTVLKAIRERLPKADIVYFGDIKNAPYGVRSIEELSELTVRAIELLQKEGAENIVSACNSVSAAIAASLADTLPKQLVEMVGPTVNAFKESPAKILLVATPATISSEIYQNAFKMIGKEIEVLPIEPLAGQIEFGASDAEIEDTIRKTFEDVDLTGVDTLLLGCTHYPLVRDIFERVVPGIEILDPATAVAARVAEQMGASEEGTGSTRFLISRDSEPFRRRIAQMLPATNYIIRVLE
jgi:glutamate racemase